MSSIPAKPGEGALHLEKLPFDPGGVRRFLRVSHGVLGADPRWVAPMLDDARRVLSDANPFFRHATLEWWVARRGGRDVGRIAGIVDRRYQERWDRGAGSFGFFECVEDPAVATALFDTVRAWGRERGLQRLVGPMNPSANDECGLLVDGFDTDPTLLMPYNPAYYAGLYAAGGCRPLKDLLAYRIEVAGMPVARLERVARRFRDRHPELQFQMVRKRGIEAQFPLIRTIYNEAWEDNWGFVPMTGEELEFMAGRLVPMLTEGLVWVATWAGEPAGLLVTVLDYNEAIKPLKGRLLSPGLPRFLPYLLGWRRPRGARVILLGVRREFRRRGIEALLLHQGLRVAQRLGIQHAEASWILEDNTPVIRTIADQGGRVSKVYRMFELPLAP